MFWQDVRYAVRTLRSNLGVTLTAILCLSMGIGLNGAIFSVVDGVLLQPFPYRDADRIVVVRLGRASAPATRRRLLEGLPRPQRTEPDAGDDRRVPGAIAHAFGQHDRARALHRRHRLVRPVRPARNAAGARPGLSARATTSQRRTVVMLSDEVWRQRYDGDPAIVGRSISSTALPHTVIGVMPPKFMFPENAAPVGSGGAVLRCPRRATSAPCGDGQAGAGRDAAERGARSRWRRRAARGRLSQGERGLEVQARPAARSG